MITKDTATDIALAHREIETAEELLKHIEEAARRRQEPDLRDVFGRRHGGLELGVPSGSTSHRLFNVPFPLARVVIAAHIDAQRAILAALNVKAAEEAKMDAAIARLEGGE